MQYKSAYSKKPEDLQSLYLLSFLLSICSAAFMTEMVTKHPLRKKKVSTE